jgi:hypothetical protein
LEAAKDGLYFPNGGSDPAHKVFLEIQIIVVATSIQEPAILLKM